MQLLINILKTDRAYEKSKVRLYLHDVGFQGLLMLMQGQPSSLEMTHLLTDIILSRGFFQTTRSFKYLPYLYISKQIIQIVTQEQWHLLFLLLKKIWKSSWNSVKGFWDLCFRDQMHLPLSSNK